MAAALGTYSSLTVTRPIRIEGHTSNVENPIYFKQFVKATIAETTEAGDTYIIPHKFDSVTFINTMPLTALVAASATYGVDATSGLFFANSATISGPTAFTTAATAGASTCVLVSVTGSAVNDNYNGAWLEIRYPSGNKQIVQITDYVHTGTIATLAEPLTEAIVASTTYYVLKGTLCTINSPAATPTLAFEVTGTFN
jgi:hypothetical protein